MSGIKTQRSWGHYGYKNGLKSITHSVDAPEVVPVLVVPEAAITGCGHGDAEQYDQDHCCECGSWRVWDYVSLGYKHFTSGWQRPRILRVKR